MATFTESKKTILGGVDGKQFVFVDGTLEIKPKSGTKFRPSPKPDEVLPAELFGLNQICGAFPLIDDEKAYVFPVVSSDRRGLQFMSAGKLYEPLGSNLRITLIGVV